MDTSAIIALLLQERGYEFAQDNLGNSLVSLINVSEIVQVLIRKGWEYKEALEMCNSLIKNIAIPDLETMYNTCKIKDEYSELNISLGDCYCLGLGMQKGLPVITTDQEWKKIRKKTVEVICLR